MYESVDEIPKDLKYLATAFHVWPKDVVKVRLDGDGEICFGPTQTCDFYPEDLEEAKRNHLYEETYSESDWVNARSVMGIPSLEYKPEDVAFDHNTSCTTPDTRVKTSRGNGTVKLGPDVNGYITVQLDAGEYILISPGFCEELESEEDAMDRWVEEAIEALKDYENVECDISFTEALYKSMVNGKLRLPR